MPYMNLSIHTSRPSERKYEVHNLKTSNYFGNQPIDQIYVDEETGMIVSNIAKFEKWIKTLES